MDRAPDPISVSDIERYRAYSGQWGEPVGPVIEIVAEAVVAPFRRVYKDSLGIALQDSATFREDRSVCTLSLHLAGLRTTQNIPGSYPSEISSRAGGNHVFGGMLKGHFGHFIVESLSRLWAIKQLSGLESVVFIRSAEIPFVKATIGWELKLQPYVSELLKLLGIDLPLTVLSGAAASFERLAIPSQLFGFHQLRGNKRFHQFVHRLQNVKLDSLADLPKRVYVSRRKVAQTGAGGILCEGVIEENLRSSGFTVIYPEELSIAEQLHYYNCADKLIFAEGSALHLFGFVAKPNQAVAVLKRRDAALFPAVVQLENFGPCKVVQLSCYQGQAIRPKGTTLTGFGLLEFDRLRRELEQHGYIESRTWRSPSAAEWESELQEFSLSVDTEPSHTEIPMQATAPLTAPAPHDRASASDVRSSPLLQRVSANAQSNSAGTEALPAAAPAEERPEEIHLTGESYHTVFAHLHALMKPTNYLEIGTDRGTTLGFASCQSIAVDPSLGNLNAKAVGSKRICHFYQMTSDRFFAEVNPKALFGQPIAMAFLDGMHLFEFLLRDFMNTEQHCARDSLILLHDCVPCDDYITVRDNHDSLRETSRNSTWWTGDVWKLVPILRKYRPDLRMVVMDAAPTGLVLVTDLDPTSEALCENYSEIVREFEPLTLTAYGFDRFLRDCDLRSTQELEAFLRTADWEDAKEVA